MKNLYRFIVKTGMNHLQAGDREIPLGLFIKEIKQEGFLVDTIKARLDDVINDYGWHISSGMLKFV